MTFSVVPQDTTTRTVQHRRGSAVSLYEQYATAYRLPWSTPGFARQVTRSAHCGRCGRKTGWRKDGNRIKHRTEADNPCARYCEGDDE